MKVLVTGWFSFEQMGASAGDLLAKDVACIWLKELDAPYDVALASPFSGGVDWRTVDPAQYSHLLFVCGPFGNGRPVTDLLSRFQHCGLVGLNLSMLQSLEEWNPFDLLLERDSSRRALPDLAFLSQRPPVPVVGIVLIDHQPEYGKRARHQEANEAIQRLVSSHDLSTVKIDTRLDVNATGQATAAQVESLIARMDVVLTTRLHGLVLSLKNAIPAVAIDTVAGGAKLTRQAEAVGWPVLLHIEDLDDERLHRALHDCLTDEAKAKARECAQTSRETLQNARDTFVQWFSKSSQRET